MGTSTSGGWVRGVKPDFTTGPTGCRIELIPPLPSSRSPPDLWGCSQSVPSPILRRIGLTYLEEGIWMSQTDHDKAAAHGKIIARAWRDPAFKASVLADPHAALKEAGVDVPAGVTVKVVENTDTHVHLVLPPKPSGELSDEALARVAAGSATYNSYDNYNVYNLGNYLVYQGPYFFLVRYLADESRGGIPMSQTDQDKATAAHGKIIARAWRDPAFKAKLLADPHAALKEAGLAVPEGVTVKAANSDSHFHLAPPPKPSGELSDEALDRVAGGI